jgi:predicted metal-dependent hydrolase
MRRAARFNARAEAVANEFLTSAAAEGHATIYMRSNARAARASSEISGMSAQKKIRDDASTRPARRVKRELLKIDGKSVEIILRTNPRARRFIVKVDPATGEVSVVAPSSRSFDRALDFARKEKEWIAGRLADVPEAVQLELGSTILFRGVEYAIRSGEGKGAPVWIDRDALRPTIRVGGRPEHAQRRLMDWLKREARRRIDERVRNMHPFSACAEADHDPRHVQPLGLLLFGAQPVFLVALVLAPSAVLDYVVAHEVSHLRELNHVHASGVWSNCWFPTSQRARLGCRTMARCCTVTLRVSAPSISRWINPRLIRSPKWRFRRGYALRRSGSPSRNHRSCPC